jgi:hypothetical protein
MPNRSAVGEWRRLVAHLVWDQGVAGSNPVSPTIDRKVYSRPSMLGRAFIILCRLKAAIERETDGLRPRITSCGSLAIYRSIRTICEILPNPQRLWGNRAAAIPRRRPYHLGYCVTPTVITPSGLGAMEVGLVLDEERQRFVVLTFKEPGGEPLLVTFTVPIFQNYVEHLVRTAKAANEEANWVIPG